jgi:F-type H+-transporting ATPase subunit b
MTSLKTNPLRRACIAVALAIVAIKTPLALAAVEHAEAPAHAESAEEQHGDPNPLAVDPDLAIFTGVIFVALFLVLRIFAWPQISAALEERERKIAENIAAAEARHADAKRLLAEHEAKLAAAAGEVRALLDEARRDAEHTKKSIEAEGQKMAKEELDRALREIRRARDATVQDLAETSANMAIDLAQKVIREQLSPEKNNQIVRDAVAKLTAEPSKN